MSFTRFWVIKFPFRVTWFQIICLHVLPHIFVVHNIKVNKHLSCYWFLHCISQSDIYAVNLQSHLEFDRNVVLILANLWNWRDRKIKIVNEREMLILKWNIDQFRERMVGWLFAIWDNFWIRSCSFYVCPVPRWPFDRNQLRQRGRPECSSSKWKSITMSPLHRCNLDRKQS